MFNIIRKNIVSYLPSAFLSPIQKYITNQPLNLGRWKTETIEKTNWKIDLANEDHCGVCSEYILTKKIYSIKPNKQIK